MSQILVNAGVTGLACRDSGRLRNDSRLYFFFYCSFCFLLSLDHCVSCCVIMLSESGTCTGGCGRSEQSGTICLDITFAPLRGVSLLLCLPSLAAYLPRTQLSEHVKSRQIFVEQNPQHEGELKPCLSPCSPYELYIGLQSYPRGVKL